MCGRLLIIGSLTSTASTETSKHNSGTSTNLAKKNVFQQYQIQESLTAIAIISYHGQCVLNGNTTWFREKKTLFSEQIEFFWEAADGNTEAITFHICHCCSAFPYLLYPTFLRFFVAISWVRLNFMIYCLILRSRRNYNHITSHSLDISIGHLFSYSVHLFIKDNIHKLYYARKHWHIRK